MKVHNFLRALVELEIWMVGVAILASMVAVWWLPWVVVLLAGFWLLRWAIYRKATLFTPVDIPIVCLVLVIPINYWLSPLPEKTLPQLLRLLSGIGLFYAIVNWAGMEARTKPEQGRKRLSMLVGCFAVGAFGLAAFSFVSVLWVTDKLAFIPDAIYSFLTVLVADTVHPNVMAGTLILLLPLAFGVLIFAGNSLPAWQKGAYALMILLGTGVVILTQSRGAFVSFAMVMGVILCVRWPWGWVGVGIGGGMLFWAIRQMSWERVMDMVLTSATLGGLGGREQIWRRALYVIQDFPLTGVGMGLFGDVVDRLYPFSGVEPGRIPHAHQLFLQVAVDIGLPGLAAWLAILAGIFGAAWGVYRAGKRDRDGWLTGLGVGLMGSQLALCLHGLLDAVTWGMVRSAPVVWGIWGLAIAAWMLHEKQ